jgi:hypothetical protein
VPDLAFGDVSGMKFHGIISTQTCSGRKDALLQRQQGFLGQGWYVSVDDAARARCSLQKPLVDLGLYRDEMAHAMRKKFDNDEGYLEESSAIADIVVL